MFWMWQCSGKISGDVYVGMPNNLLDAEIGVVCLKKRSDQVFLAPSRGSDSEYEVSCEN
jgi:hypothetical protein